ncbi:hypothetical protein [Amycolatopsis jejuensis]|nr:hypothetical protein [Amycolatopsis jejuensis]
MFPAKPVTDTASAASLVASAKATTAAPRRGTPSRQEAGKKPTAVALPT